jgi:dipeptidyl-peptidase-4
MRLRRFPSLAPRRVFGLIPILLLLAAAFPLGAQQSDSLDLDRLFASSEFFGRGIGQVRWLGDGTYTTVERADSGGADIVRHWPRDDRQDVLVAAAALVPAGRDEPLEIHGYSWSNDFARLLIFTNSRRVWRGNTRGDYWVLDRDSGTLRQLGTARPSSSMMYAKFSPDGTRVAYVSENNLYVEDLGSGAVTPLTTDGSRTILNGRFDWVYEEEIFNANPFAADGFRWSPDGTRIAYWQLDASGVRDFLLINDTDSLYSFTIPVQYPKAGTTNSAVRVGIVPATGGRTTWLALDGDTRNYYIARMEWAENSREVVIQHLNRLQNALTLMLGDAATGTTRTIFTETDPTWVDFVDDMRWLDDGRRFTWPSERDGWKRLYVVNRDGSGMAPLTPPNTDVMDVVLLDDKGGWLYYIASPNEPTRRYLYRVKLDGSMKATRLSPASERGWHSYDISPDGRWAFHTYSTFETPPVVSLIALPAHKLVRTLENNAALRDQVTAIKRRPTRFFRVTTTDGITLDGWMMLPNAFDPSKKWPVLFYVYGEPWGTTVADRWGGTQMLWHQYLTQLGYVVMSLDNRGTPVPRGRAWRKSIYQKIGVITSRDEAMGRIGIWGWSGGGSSTLNAMFRYPDVYRTGMAVAPVPDMRYYDTIYQERYMGLPGESPEAYEQGSPITFAGNLAGNLLLVHGTGDDNVHYQGTEALINKLIENGKPFSMMAYPNRSHGIFEGRGTTRHVYGLLTRYLTEHLPAGPR